MALIVLVISGCDRRGLKEYTPFNALFFITYDNKGLSKPIKPFRETPSQPQIRIEDMRLRV